MKDIKELLRLAPRGASGLKYGIGVNAFLVLHGSRPVRGE